MNNSANGTGHQNTGVALASSFLRPTRLITVVLSVLAWCGLWGTFSVANVLSGLAVAITVVALGLGPSNQANVRFVPLARLGWMVLVDMVTSTANVAFEVMTPTDHTDESIVGVDLALSAHRHLYFLTTAVTLTPGTAVVAIDEEAPRMYLHLLHDSRREATIKHVQELAALVEEALPVSAATLSNEEGAS